MLKPQEVKELSQLSPARTLGAIAADWGLIVLVFAVLIAWPGPLTWIAAFILIGRQQLALAILMHDGSHRRLFKSHSLNDGLGQWLLAAPLLFSMDSYKKLHLKHHTDPLAPDDPDLSLIGGYPISKASFRRKISRDLLGISYFKFIRYFIYMQRKAPKQPTANGKGGVLVSIVVAQAVILGALTAVGHPWLYLFFWLLPAMTILQVLLRIRGIAEHAGYAQNANQALNARTVIHPVQTFLFAPHGVHYHIEHHLYPSVPFCNLPKLHKLLSERDALPAANVYRSYGQVLRELIN